MTIFSLTESVKLLNTTAEEVVVICRNIHGWNCLSQFPQSHGILRRCERIRPFVPPGIDCISNRNKGAPRTLSPDFNIKPIKDPFGDDSNSCSTPDGRRTKQDVTHSTRQPQLTTAKQQLRHSSLTHYPQEHLVCSRRPPALHPAQGKTTDRSACRRHRDAPFPVQHAKRSVRRQSGLMRQKNTPRWRSQQHHLTLTAAPYVPTPST